MMKPPTASAHNITAPSTPATMAPMLTLWGGGGGAGSRAEALVLLSELVPVFSGEEAGPSSNACILQLHLHKDRIH